MLFRVWVATETQSMKAWPLDHRYPARWPQTWKPGILRDFSEHGKLRNSVQPQGKIVTNKVFLVRDGV